MMNVLREEVSDSGIKIVNIFPGAVYTSMWPKNLRKKFKDEMMDPEVFARLVYETSCRKNGVILEEVVVRPQGGDIQI